jgi:hypothetical protein
MYVNTWWVCAQLNPRFEFRMYKSLLTLSAYLLLGSKKGLI